SAARLRYGERRDLLPLYHGWKHEPLDLFAPRRNDRRQRDRVRVDRGLQTAGAATGVFFGEDQFEEDVARTATIFLGKPQSGSAKFGRSSIEVPGERSRLVPFAHKRGDLAGNEFAKRVAKLLMFLRKDASRWRHCSR